MTKRYDFKTGNYTFSSTMSAVAGEIAGLHAERPLDFILVGEYHTVTSHKAAQLVLTDQLTRRSLVGAFADEVPAPVAEQAAEKARYQDLVSYYAQQVRGGGQNSAGYHWLKHLAADAPQLPFQSLIAMHIKATACQIPFQFVDCQREYIDTWKIKADLSPEASQLLQSTPWFRKIAADYPVIAEPNGLRCGERDGMTARDLMMAANIISLKQQTPRPVLARVGQGHIGYDKINGRPSLPHMLTETGYNIVTVSMIPERHLCNVHMGCDKSVEQNPRPENLAGDIRINTYGAPDIETNETDFHHVLLEDIHTMLHGNRRGPIAWARRMVEKWELRD